MLEDIGPSKLLEVERERVRLAADTLILSDDGAEAREALDDARALLDHLVEADRWTEERASHLLDELGGCGPLAALA
jgi:hypothetical protein